MSLFTWFIRLTTAPAVHDWYGLAAAPPALPKRLDGIYAGPIQYEILPAKKAKKIKVKVVQ